MGGVECVEWSQFLVIRMYKEMVCGIFHVHIHQIFFGAYSRSFLALCIRHVLV